MGGRSFAGAVVARHLDKLVYTTDDDRFVRRVRGDGLELYRTLGLWCKHRCFAVCPDCFSRILDLAVGSGWPGAFYPYDGMFGSNWTTCSARRVSRDPVKRGSTTHAS